MARTMKAIAKLAPEAGATVIEAPIPQPQEGEVLVKVEASAICGTDAHIYNWDPWAASRIKPPLIFGHEFCGYVSQLGAGVNGVCEGDFVSVETHFTCGVCRFCRTGRGHICQKVEIVGVDRDGCFAEYVTVPAENLWKWEHHVDPEVAAIQDPFGNAVHTALECDLLGAQVLITGVGPIGLSAIPVCLKAGAAQVICTDVSDYRLDLAKRLGAHQVINVKEESMVDKVYQYTNGQGTDVLLEMSGHPIAIADGLKTLVNGGEVALLGIPSNPVELDLASEIIFKGARVYGINGRKMYKTWYQAQSLLASGLDLKPLITHRVTFDEFKQGMELVKAGKCGKIIVYPK